MSPDDLRVMCTDARKNLIPSPNKRYLFGVTRDYLSLQERAAKVDYQGFPENARWILWDTAHKQILKIIQELLVTLA